MRRRLLLMRAERKRGSAQREGLTTEAQALEHVARAHPVGVVRALLVYLLRRLVAALGCGPGAHQLAPVALPRGDLAIHVGIPDGSATGHACQLDESHLCHGSVLPTSSAACRGEGWGSAGCDRS